MITIEIVYATPAQQHLTALTVPEGTTAIQALDASGFRTRFPDADFEAMGMGIFSRLLDGRGNPSPHDYVMRDGDRLELYRPLLVDPMRARQLRAAKKSRNSK